MEIAKDTEGWTSTTFSQQDGVHRSSQCIQIFVNDCDFILNACLKLQGTFCSAFLFLCNLSMQHTSFLTWKLFSTVVLYRLLFLMIANETTQSISISRNMGQLTDICKGPFGLLLLLFCCCCCCCCCCCFVVDSAQNTK